MEYTDYYKVLGVEKSASSDDIKKAFKRLARKYHPDVAKDEPEAEETFKRVNEAYEVLSDPEKRRKYDTLGANWNQGGMGGGGFRRAGGSGGGVQFDFGGSTGFSDFFESFFGSGAGSYGAGDPFRQAASRGPRKGADLEADMLVTIDEIMEGSSRDIKLSQGGGEAKTIRVKIPKGTIEGQIIRCSGLGQPGVQGSPAGDLLLSVRVEKHPLFSLDGHDVYCEVLITPWEAVLGCSAEVTTPHGTVRIKVPEGAEHGQLMRLRGKGLILPKEAGFGDAYAGVEVVYPTDISAAERELWEKLAEVSDFRPRDI